MKILLADQNRDFLSGYRKLLSAEGYEIQTAFDGTQVLEKTAEKHFDLVLIAERMPRIHTSRLVEYLNEENIPVIILSEAGERETMDYFLQKKLRIAGILCFPFEPEDIRKKIELFQQTEKTDNGTKEGEEG